MSEFRHIRYEPTSRYTLGILPDLPELPLLHTLEPPWLYNRRNVSCVPPGTYDLRCVGGELMRIRMDGPGIIDVHDREMAGDEIELDHIKRFNCDYHIGNFLRDSTGCVLVGMGIGWDSVRDEPRLFESRKAMEHLYALIERTERPSIRIEERG